MNSSSEICMSCVCKYCCKLICLCYMKSRTQFKMQSILHSALTVELLSFSLLFLLFLVGFLRYCTFAILREGKIKRVAEHRHCS